LSLPLLDKDQILETLFDSLGCDDREQRHRLSRASDEILFRVAASSSGGAVVVNWWNHQTAPARLSSVADSLIEIFCDCPIEEAAARFAARERHRDHLDQLRTPEEHEEGIRRLRESYRGPLRLNGAAPLVVDTSRPVDVGALLATVRGAIASTCK
jgi:hypothetical protein